jgi:Putative regulator of cell autolysis
MESRFGYDFSGVRIHTDAKAAESARAIDALAYTVGRDVVFGTGQHTPETGAGRLLLAHELTHVVQQPVATVSSPLQLGHSEDASEHQANTTAMRVMSNHPTRTGLRAGIPHPAALPGNTIRRSLLGGILSAIGGALGGALLGGLLGGPIGAIVGGVVGLVGGALAGDRATTRRRRLTSPEIQYAKAIFKDSIDYSAIIITRDSMLSTGAPRTIGNTIHLRSDWGHFKQDTLELTPTGMETLIHEMGHVWQYQNGGLAYIPESIWAQFKAALSGKSRNAAYDWRAMHTAKVPWEQWNPEQQAQAIEDYNILLRKSKNGTASVAELAELSVLALYMRYVWRRKGAPHFTPPKLEGAI